MGRDGSGGVHAEREGSCFEGVIHSQTFCLSGESVGLSAIGHSATACCAESDNPFNVINHSLVGFDGVSSLYRLGAGSRRQDSLLASPQVART
eukprot:768463-Hanusia_phi.AAC.11